MTTQPQSAAPLDYEGLMQVNLFRVFSERDAGRRIEAIRELYAEDAVLNEPHASAKGHAAISRAAGRPAAELRLSRSLSCRRSPRRWSPAVALWPG